MPGDPSMSRAALDGAVGGAAAAVLLAVVLLLVALFSGGSVAVPGLIVATGGSANGAVSVEFTPGWVVLAAAAAVGAAVQIARARRLRSIRG